MTAPQVLAIIPARGGSKGVPRKNVKSLAGKPLIAHIIETAKAARGVDRVLVSTEDTEIAAVARQYGADVPFIRPAELAHDETPTLPVLQHAVAWLANHEAYHPEYVLLVYPTSPLLRAARIEEAIALSRTTGADSVISGTLDKGHFWIEADGLWQRLYPTKLENRQRSRPAFRENGAIYLTRTSVLATQVVADRAAVLLMGADENVDIDTPEDFVRAATLLVAKIER